MYTQLRNELDLLHKKVQIECEDIGHQILNIEKVLATVDDNISFKQHEIENIPNESKKNNQVGITQIDPYIEFINNFREEIINTFYNNAQMWNYTMGAWYYKIKRILYYEPILRKKLRITNVESLSISQDLLLAIIDATEKVTIYPMYDSTVSDFEAALCILAAFYSVFTENKMDEHTTIIDICKLLPTIFKSLTNELAIEKNISNKTQFIFNDPDDMKFFIPLHKGRHYSTKTFNNHVLIKIFIRKKIFQKIPGDQEAEESNIVKSQISGNMEDDRLLYWTYQLLRPKLHNNIPIFIHQQQYLRSGLTAIGTLYLIWKIVNSESVFGKRSGKFYLSTIFPHMDKISINEPDFISKSIHNFEFLLENYIIPSFIHDPEITISKLFPGIVCLLVTESVRTGWNQNKKATNINTLHIQTIKNPIIEYIISQFSEDDDLTRLEKHDSALFHFENGLNLALSFTLPKQRILSIASSLFNVHDMYDLLYFLVFGFLPIAAVI